MRRRRPLRARRPPPPPLPRRPRPPPAVPGATYNQACNCYEPPVYPTVPPVGRRGQRTVNINLNNGPTPLVPNLWATATPTASIWGAAAATTDPLLWGATGSLWPSTGLWTSPLATSGIVVP